MESRHDVFGDEIDIVDDQSIDEIVFYGGGAFSPFNHWTPIGGEKGATHMKALLPLENPNAYEFINLREPRSETRERFQSLVEEWRAETEWFSSINRKVMHPAYQKIIGMGPEALPLILDELRTRPAYWYWALTAITGEDPARETRRMSEARATWLAWATEHGY